TEGAQAVAEELGFLPLALAQAAAVIAGQRLGYGTYLQRLRRLPVSDLLPPVRAGQYPRSAAAAILLSLDSARAGADGQACDAALNLLAVLSPAGVPRELIHDAGRRGLLSPDEPSEGLPPEAVDRVLGQLAHGSLLAFSLDGTTVIVHRLVMRVIRDQLGHADGLTSTCE